MDRASCVQESLGWAWWHADDNAGDGHAAGGLAVDDAGDENNPDAPVEDLSVNGPGVLRPGVPTLREDGHAGAQ